MKLSDLKDKININVFRDAICFSLGMVYHKFDKMLVYAETDAYVDEAIKNNKVSAIVTKLKYVSKIPNHIGIIISENSKIEFFNIHNYLFNNTNFYGRKFKSKIHPNAKIHPLAYVASFNVEIDEGCIIEPFVAIMENSKLGKNVILRSGCKIGVNGFEFKKNENKILGVEHAGGVVISDNVEIQANTTIDKAIFSHSTLIGENTKVNDLCYIAHGVEIGKRCIITAKVSLCGSSLIGDDVYIGPGAIISNQVRIGNNAYVTIGSVVTKNIYENERVTGNFAIPHEKFMNHLKSIL